MGFCPFPKVHICMPHSQPTNYIVYSVREKTCTARDCFVYLILNRTTGYMQFHSIYKSD